MLFKDFVHINPSVRLAKAEKYPFVPMEALTPGRRYVKAPSTRLAGGGAKFQHGDTLFARITPCLENGKIAQFIESPGQTGFGSTEYWIFRAKEGISDPAFVYYFATTDLIRKSAEKSMAGASGRQRADIAAVEELDINVPDLPTQRRIASILSAYDDLIENNTRRINILEEIARNLYEEWFVRFRFPGHEQVKMVESALGRTPKDWIVQSVNDTFEILGGGTPSKANPEYWNEGTINWYSPSDLTKAGTAFMDESNDKITPLGLKKSSARTFPAFSVMMTSRATIGVVAVNTTEACTNQGFITCLPNNSFPLWILFHWLKSNVELFISLGKGATFKEINKGTFKGIKLIVPPNNLVRNFNSTVTQLMELSLSLQRKNANLQATRDLLLPKLISGKLDLSNLPDPMEVNAG